YGDEADVLKLFYDTVREKDPDFLVCPRCDEFTLPYLLKRARLIGLNLQLGRNNWNADLRGLTLHGVSGRVFLEYTYFQENGIAGLVELSRFSMLPPGVASRWTANRVIDSRNCFELLRRGYVIPRNFGGYGFIRPLNMVVDRDRGGLVIGPKVGLHENVAELDFESQYPNLIMRYGLSYETVTPQGIIDSGEPLLPYVTSRILERRLRFKRLRKKYPKGSMEWVWCEQRQSSLKSILVCLYGASGCCWNRFGNVLCFEEINLQSRRTLVETKEFVQQRGFEVVYADTDSIFVKKLGATREEYEALAAEIEERTGLPIALDHHYNFLVLLPSKADLSGMLEAEKRYFGILTDGELVTRGIESRRHDTPEFIKEFQQQLIRTLLNYRTAEEVALEGYSKAIEYVNETKKRILHGEVPIRQLIVTKTLRKPIDTYRTVAPHVAAAINLAYHGKTTKDGEDIDLIYVNARHSNPLRRSAPAAIHGEECYDRQKYCSLALNAAETILAPFGFKRLNCRLPHPLTEKGQNR
ncbi:MAG: DNA polymerase domain-containing protein, partial [Candidatus Bathyarchaeia archaeon]